MMQFKCGIWTLFILNISIQLIIMFKSMDWNWQLIKTTCCCIKISHSQVQLYFQKLRYERELCLLYCEYLFAALNFHCHIDAHFLCSLVGCDWDPAISVEKTFSVTHERKYVKLTDKTLK